MQLSLKFFLFMVLIVPINTMAQPFGSGGVEYIKFSGYLNEQAGSKFYEIKCNVGDRVGVLFEPKNSNGWFILPPGDKPLPFYSGPSVKIFAQTVCGELPSVGQKSSVAKISGGVGTTPSGNHLYEVVCRSGRRHNLVNSVQGLWWTTDFDDLNLDKQKGHGVRNVAETICSK